MSGRRTKNVRRGNLPTKRFADDRLSGDQAPKNHTAQAKRPLRKLKELLCDRGYHTDGAACPSCESPCRFGEEYLARQKEGDTL
ncbi:MAG: hypothetical protein GX171_02540 [Clostridiales bacterium]|nr:hypothetical protein [Clostridiales bacterium]